MRNFLTTLFLSQGVPMLLGGDELARTQRGNNNAYCQDNELSWFDWELDERRQRLLEFTRRLIQLRHAHPVFRRTQFLTGELAARLGAAGQLVVPDGRPEDDPARLGRRGAAHGRPVPERRGDPRPDAARRRRSPTSRSSCSSTRSPSRRRSSSRRGASGRGGSSTLSTAEPEAAEGEQPWPARGEVEVESRSILLLRRGRVVPLSRSSAPSRMASATWRCQAGCRQNVERSTR